MNLIDLMGLGSPDKYGTETVVMTNDVSITLDSSYLLTLQPDQDDRVLIVKPMKVGGFVVIKNDSGYQVTIRNEAKSEINEYTLLAGNVVKLYILDFGDFIAIDESVPEFIPSVMEYKIQASNAGSGDYFGYSVSMNGDGTKCAVGARYEDVDGFYNTGAVYIFSWNGSSWVEDQRLQASDYENHAYLGYSISMSSDGTKVISGASREDSGGSSSGAAYIFGYNGTTWVEEQKLVASDTTAGAFFGEDVDISDDGTRCIVGGHGSTVENDGGAAYVYFWNGTSWIEEQKVMASDISPSAYFGCSVALSADGTRCLVGSYAKPYPDNIGSAYIFTRSGTVWTEEQIISASNPSTNDYFGGHVDMSGDGVRCLVSSIGQDDGGGGAGMVYSFSRSGTTWTEEQMILPDDVGSGYAFGGSMVLSSDGARCIIAASSGEAAYIFGYNGTTWVQEKKLVASDTQSGDDFGENVSISGDGTRCISGAPKEDTGSSNAGSAYIYHNI